MYEVTCKEWKEKKTNRNSASFEARGMSEGISSKVFVANAVL